jgi:hypothetical protein
MGRPYGRPWKMQIKINISVGGHKGGPYILLYS